MVEGALRDGEAACARVTLFGDTIHREGVIVVEGWDKGGDWAKKHLYLFRERRDEEMADFSFFFAAENNNKQSADALKTKLSFLFLIFKLI